MVMKLDNVVPFGRSFDEYKRMFDLNEDELRLNILGVGDGPASFNGELSQLGGKIISVDPIYCFSAQAIRTKFYDVVDDIISQVKSTPGDWVWSYHRSPEHLHDHRIQVTEQFCQDYARSNGDGRYIAAQLPQLPFKDDAFDLAVCSHFLFLYAQQFNKQFHLLAIREMLRVAKQVRVFPLINLNLQAPEFLSAVLQELTAEHVECKIRTSNYELQRGGNRFLQLFKTAERLRP